MHHLLAGESMLSEGKRDQADGAAPARRPWVLSVSRAWRSVRLPGLAFCASPGWPAGEGRTWVLASRTLCRSKAIPWLPDRHSDALGTLRGPALWLAALTPLSPRLL